MADDQAQKVAPFGLKDKISYAFGDIANDFTFILASSFLLKFYTDVMDVSAGLIGTMMMVVRLIDAVVDVTVGRVVDLSKPTKAGKFRPWILRGSIFVCVLSVLMYPVWFQDMSYGFKVVWLIVSYLLWSVMYSVVNIPYGSMASAITDSAEERTQLSVFRNAGATIAALVISVSVPMLVYDTVDGNQVFSGSKFAILAVIFSVIAFVAYLITYFGTTERVHIPSSKEQTGGTFTFLKKIVANKPFIAYCIFILFVILGQFTMQTMANYIFPNYYGNTTAQSVTSLLMSLVILAFTPFATPLANKFGKKEVATVGLLISGILFVALFLVKPSSVVIFSVLFIIAYLGMGVANCYVFAIVVDIIDYDEVKTGLREDGTIYSSYSFFRKVAQSLASGLSGILLSAIGYTAATAYDDDVLDGIYNITTVVPAVFFIVACVVIWKFYPLTKDIVKSNADLLASKREEVK